MNWIVHTNKTGQACAKCATCGWNAALHNLGTERDCNNCLDLAEEAQLAEMKQARWEAMSASLLIVDIEEAPSALAALSTHCFGK
jgi:hypothetical protein